MLITTGRFSSSFTRVDGALRAIASPSPLQRACWLVNRASGRTENPGCEGHRSFSIISPSLRKSIYDPLICSVSGAQGCSLSLPSAPSIQLSLCRHRKFLSTTAYHDKSQVVWKHNHVNVTTGGYQGLTLDEFHWMGTASVKRDEACAPEPSSQILNALQLGSNPPASQKPISVTHTQDVFILYLPRGPFPGYTETEATAFDRFLEIIDRLERSHTLAANRRLSVIRINYRLSHTSPNNRTTERYPYPIPVFDVRWGLDYVKKQYEDEFLDGATLSVYGENIGASLGLTLAFTNYDDLHAVAVADPMTDWTALDELADPNLQTIEPHVTTGQTSDTETISESENAKHARRRGRKTNEKISKSALQAVQAHAARDLIDLRSKLFNTPSAFFDRYASPLLFLRAPGKDTPLWKTAKPEIGQPNTEQIPTAYGPYDDNWETKNDAISGGQHTDLKLNDDGRIDTLAEAIGTDAIEHMTHKSRDHDHELPVRQTNLDTQQSRSDVSNGQSGHSSVLDSGEQPKTVKRRKVLLRWPSVSTADDALLPYVRIISTNPKPIDPDRDAHNGPGSVDYATILSPQAREMTDVMKRACFWGRGGDLAEERVMLKQVDPREDGEDARIEAAVTWLHDMISRP